MVDLLRLDDQIYLEEGFRKEQMDRAISLYGLDKEDENKVRKLSGIDDEEHKTAISPSTATSHISKSQLILA